MIHFVFQNLKDVHPAIILRLNKEQQPPKTLLSTSSSYSGHAPMCQKLHAQLFFKVPKDGSPVSYVES